VDVTLRHSADVSDDVSDDEQVEQYTGGGGDSSQRSTWDSLVLSSCTELSHKVCLVVRQYIIVAIHQYIYTHHRLLKLKVYDTHTPTVIII